MKRTRLTLSASVVALTLFFAGCGKKEEEEVKPEVPVEVVKVSPHAVAEHLVTDAILFPKNQAAITPKVTAPVAHFLVQRGDRVKKGQLLAELENRDLAAAVRENQGAFQQAEAGYVTATRASIPEEVQKADLDLQQARQALDAQSKLLESRKALFDQGALPRKDFDQAQVAYVQAKAQFDIAQQHSNSVHSVSREQDIRAAQGQLNSAQGKYEGSKALFGYTEVRSPIDGYVTERPSYPGETAAAGTPLLTVMDTSVVIAKTHLPQKAAQALKIGNQAAIEVEGGEPVGGKVTLISPALDANSTTVEVWVTVVNKDQKLKPGSAVKVDIVARKSDAALAVPSQALVKADSGSGVMVMGSDSIAHLRQVEVGIEDRVQNLTQVSSGVNAGDQVIVNAYGLPDGAKVTLNSGKKEKKDDKEDEDDKDKSKKEKKED